MKKNSISGTIFCFIAGLLLHFLFSSCEKEKMPHEFPEYIIETDSVVDIDGNVYKTVKIGDQWWMAENLRVTRYRNQIPIYSNPGMTATEWSSLETGAYTGAGLKIHNIPIYGSLYNWYVVNNQNGLAPDGWRVPSDEDWKKLEQYIGMNKDSLNYAGWRGILEGGRLKGKKSSGLYWYSNSNQYISDERGFSAYPGGCVLHNGTFTDAGDFSSGFWWSSTGQADDKALYRHLDYKYNGIFRYYASKKCGFSIRCVRDAVN